jgi:ferritin-like metal-binding protein YciE
MADSAILRDLWSLYFVLTRP